MGAAWRTDSRQRLLYFVPRLALVVGFLARVLAMLLPGNLLRGLIKNVMGSPPDSAVETTAAFIKSKRGVRQALFVPIPFQFPFSFIGVLVCLR